MKIFNLENPTTRRSVGECIVIASFDEWQEVAAAVDMAVNAKPRSKKLRKIQADFDLLSIW